MIVYQPIKVVIDPVRFDFAAGTDVSPQPRGQVRVCAVHARVDYGYDYVRAPRPKLRVFERQQINQSPLVNVFRAAQSRARATAGEAHGRAAKDDRRVYNDRVE